MNPTGNSASSAASSLWYSAIALLRRLPEFVAAFSDTAVPSAFMLAVEFRSAHTRGAWRSLRFAKHFLRIDKSAERKKCTRFSKSCRAIFG